MDTGFFKCIASLPTIEELATSSSLYRPTNNAIMKRDVYLSIP